MSKTLMTLAALGVITATPAFADPGMRNREPVVASTDAVPAPTRTKNTRYCVMTEPQTGFRIGQRVCQTRDQWLKEGFDPLNPRGR